MKNSSNLLDQKQTYLRSQIIDSGVDPEPFMVFMGAYKGQGENINLQNWTLFDLKKVVQQFKGSLELELNRQEQMSKITNQKAAINYRASQQVADRVMGSNLPKKQKVFYERDDLWDYQLKIDQQCKKTYQFFNFKSFPRISCKAIQVKKEGGFLFGIIGAKNYIEITLSPNFCSHTIARKSQDVDWLRASLVSLYPGSFVPPLEQTPVMQFQNKAIVGKRAKQILDFVNSLVHFDHLINNKFTHMFFTEGDQKLFQTFKQKNVVVPINNLKGIQTFEGHFPLEISQRIQDLVKKSSRYSKQVSGLYKNIQETMVKISNDYNSLNKNFIVLFKDLSKVKQKYESLSQQCNIQQSPHNIEFDKRMMAMMKHLTDLVQTLQALSHKQANTIKQINEQHIKVMIKQWNQFDNLEARYKKQLDSYLAFRLSMYKKKQQFFLDLSKKQLQLRQKNGSTNETTLSQKQELYKAKYSGENKIQQDRRQWQGYLNYMYQKSFMNLLGEQEKQLQQKMSQVSRMFDKKLTQVAQKHHNFDKFLNDSGLIMVEQQVHQKK